MPFLASMEGQYGYGRPAPPPSNPTGIGGSISFNGTASVNLSIPNDLDFRMGTGDFTIEWFQYMLSGGGSAERIFSIGTYSTASIAVSFEGPDTNRTLYAWVSSANSIAFGNYLNAWIHFAICRSGTNLRVFQNGVQIGTTSTNSTNFADATNALRIGNETTTSTIAAYKGYITNFRWVKGSALYTSNFSKPTAPLTAVSGTKLLLLASTSGTSTTDSSGLNKTVTNNGTVWSNLNPF
jgi:hypothetical protein